MNTQTATNRFIVPPRTSYAALYQQLLSGFVDYERMGKSLVAYAEQARVLRQFNALSEVGLILTNLPIGKFQAIGEYYVALGLCRYGFGELDKGRILLEQVASTAPLKFRAEALVSLSSISGVTNQPEEMLRYCLEACAMRDFDVTTIKALRGIAVVKSLEGFHRSALRDLEKLHPAISHAPPHIYLDYLNSMAVELTECGRLKEARNISKLTCSSPLVAVYPEWRETAEALRPARKSFVAVSNKLISESAISAVKSEKARPIATSENQTKTASVLSFPKLKQAPQPEKPESVTPQELDGMNANDKREFILTALRSNSIRESEYNKLIFMMGLLKGGPAVNVIDLEDEAVLDELIVKWAALVEPEELAAVLSALRDCEDDIRRSNILDRMIRKAFEESRTCGLTEEQWRLKVERRLPK